MNLLTLIKLLLSFADGLTSYLNKQQMLDAGEHIQKSKNLQSALDAVQKANAIRDDVRAGKLPDPFLRD
jgi:hypothetical protein